MGADAPLHNITPSQVWTLEWWQLRSFKICQEIAQVASPPSPLRKKRRGTIDSKATLHWRLVSASKFISWNFSDGRKGQKNGRCLEVFKNDCGFPSLSCSVCLSSHPLFLNRFMMINIPNTLTTPNEWMNNKLLWSTRCTAGEVDREEDENERD